MSLTKVERHELGCNLGMNSTEFKRWFRLILRHELRDDEVRDKFV